jgi:V/A-type H+-transporting ATPase subunit C
MSPTVFNDHEVGELLQAGQFGALPECMAVCAREAYELLAGAGGGQMADAVIDRQCLETILAIADTSGSEFIRGLAKNICAFANAKIAMRAEKTGKGQDFLKIALCGCPPAELPEEARQSGAAFEKYCDDALIEYALPAKWVTFGIAPLAAYYLAKEAEVKNVRIVMTCKQNGVPADEIRKRVRRLYV